MKFLLKLLVFFIAFSCFAGDLPVNPATIPTDNTAFWHDLQVKTTTEMPQHLQDNYGKLRYITYVTSYRRNDAIVKPGQEGASHLHTFFNSHINTPTISISDLTIGKFTNDGGTVDGSAYWMPAMVDISDNSIIPYPMAKTPSGILTYVERNYRRSRFSIIEPFPKDLRMVVGNANATTAQWTNPNASNAFFSYQCKSPTGSALSIEQATIPACAQGNKLTIKFITPSCYDGRLDSPDHISHTRWITNWRCQQWSTGTVKISGTPGTVIPLNTTLTTVTGIQYLTQAKVTIGTSGTANVTIKAVNHGLSGNNVVGTVLSLVDNNSAITNIVATTDITGATANWRDIPMLFFTFGLPVTKPEGTTNWRLVSDTLTGTPGASFHFDVITNWNDFYQQLIVDNCLNANNDCGMGVFGNGEKMKNF